MNMCAYAAHSLIMHAEVSERTWQGGYILFSCHFLSGVCNICVNLMCIPFRRSKSEMLMCCTHTNTNALAALADKSEKAFAKQHKGKADKQEKNRVNMETQVKWSVECSENSNKYIQRHGSREKSGPHKCVNQFNGAKGWRSIIINMACNHKG